MDAQTLRRILYDFFRFNQRDFTVQASATGFHISATPAKQVAEHPLHCGNASAGGTPKIRVIWGTIGGVPADEMSPGDSPMAIATVGGSDAYLYANCVVDAGNIVSWSFEPREEIISPGSEDNATTVFLLLCSFTVVGDAGIGSIVDNLTGSQSFEYCGGVQALFNVI